jgi:hypothetical protein
MTKVQMLTSPVPISLNAYASAIPVRAAVRVIESQVASHHTRKDAPQCFRFPIR